MTTECRRYTMSGFSLVELMISLALGAVLTVGIIQLFAANSDSYNLLQGQSRLQESARFAMNFIGKEVRKAGYRGCFSNSDTLYTTLDPTKLPYEYDLRTSVQGFNSTGGPNWLPALTVLPRTINNNDFDVFVTPAGKGAHNGIHTKEIIVGSDVLTVRSMAVGEARLASDMPTSTEAIEVGTPADGLSFGEDELAMIHDCEKGTVFRVTDLAADTPAAGETTIGHDIGDADDTRNTFERLALVNTYSKDAAVSAIESHTFYIAPGAGLNNAGNTPLSLWRKSGIEAPVELVEGVEDMQVLFGVDTDADNAPNSYVRANEVTDWEKVKTVRVSLVVNSVDDVGGTTTPTQGCTIQDCITGQVYDGLIRRAFTETFQLRN